MQGWRRRHDRTEPPDPPAVRRQRRAWDRVVAYSLSPWRALWERGCSYRKGAAVNGTATDIDYASLIVRSVDKDTTAPGGAGCLAWPAAFGVTPAPGVRGGYDVAAPILDKEAV